MKEKKGGKKPAASDDKFAPFSTDKYQKLLSKHPQQAKFAAPNPKNLDSLFVAEFDLYKQKSSLRTDQQQVLKK